MYNRVNWQDSPSENTPLNAANLNNMDAKIKELDTAVTSLTGAVESMTQTLRNVSAELSQLTQAAAVNNNQTAPSGTIKEIGTYKGVRWLEKIIDIDSSAVHTMRQYGQGVDISDILNVARYGSVKITSITGVVREPWFEIPIGGEVTYNSQTHHAEAIVMRDTKRLFINCSEDATATIKIRFTSSES